MARTSALQRTALAAVVGVVGCGQVLGFGGLEFDVPGGAGAGGQKAQAGLGGEAGDTSGGGAAGAGGEAGAPFVIECTTHGQCVEANVGEPYICKNSRCVALKNYGSDRRGDCRVVLGAENLTKHDLEPFIFGALSSINPLLPESSPTTLNYKLAVKQFTEQGGIRIAGRSRLPVAVVCDESSDDPSGFDRTLDHLVDTVGVSAVIAAAEPPALKASFERLQSRNKNIFMISPFVSADMLLNVDDGASEDSPGLLWHLLPRPTDVARAYIPLVKRAENYVLQELAATPPLRLALVESGPAMFSEMATYVHAALRFNGKSPTDNLANYRRIAVGPEYPNALSDLKNFRPHLIVSTADDEFGEVMRQYELAVSDGDIDPAPFYVLSASQAFDAKVLGTISAFGGLRERVAGVQYASARDASVYDAYLSTLLTAFPNNPQLVDTENFYDAVYYLLYAASAGGSLPGIDELTGFDIARGMWRLLGDGPKYETLPGVISNALAYLEEDPSHTISLHGTLGAPDFDRFTGGRPGVGSVWCVDFKNFVYSVEFNVLQYVPAEDPASASLEGEFSCFPGL